MLVCLYCFKRGAVLDVDQILGAVRTLARELIRKQVKSTAKSLNDLGIENIGKEVALQSDEEVLKTVEEVFIQVAREILHGQGSLPQIGAVFLMFLAYDLR